jgi:hypothetical protein
MLVFCNAVCVHKLSWGAAHCLSVRAQVQHDLQTAQSQVLAAALLLGSQSPAPRTG